MITETELKNKYHSKEELEALKLQAEIDEIKKPFYKKATFLSLISSTLFAALTIISTIVYNNSTQKKEVEAKLLELTTKQLELKEDSLETKIAILEKEYAHKRQELENSYLKKEEELKVEYFKKLKDIEYTLADIQKDYLNNYTDGFVSTYVDKRITTQGVLDNYLPKDKQLGFKKWLKGAIGYSIKRSNERAFEQLKKRVDLEEFKLKQ
ncbi:hypothetical protein V6R21_11645 [Limibacter armeniacum]|uniref:hypothetical protein n=1 Tax=Limibacter armeniacum TaxID=466084 RepID=UPI002FE4FD3D